MDRKPISEPQIVALPTDPVALAQLEHDEEVEREAMREVHYGHSAKSVELVRFLQATEAGIKSLVSCVRDLPTAYKPLKHKDRSSVSGRLTLIA
jgi:hypothetical protein